MGRDFGHSTRRVQWQDNSIQAVDGPTDDEVVNLILREPGRSVICSYLHGMNCSTYTIETVNGDHLVPRRTFVGRPT